MWDLLAGPFLAAGGLLVVAGLPKLRDPLPLVRALRTTGLPAPGPLVRLLALAEVALGVTAVVAPGRGTAALVAVAYAGFTAFVALAVRRGGVLASCGCFGRPDTPPTRAHLVLTAGATATAAALAVSPPGAGVGAQPRRRPPPSPGSRYCWAPWPTWSSPCCPPRPSPPSAACRRGDSMLAVVVAEGVAVALLAVLVLGLLRSHALILRALHELGAGLELEEAASAPASGTTGPVPVQLEPGVVPAARPATTGPRC